MKRPKFKPSKNKAKDTEIPQQQPPNHQQALQFIDDIVALAPVSRREHIQVQQALRQIGGAIGELAELKKGKDEVPK